MSQSLSRRLLALSASLALACSDAGPEPAAVRAAAPEAPRSDPLPQVASSAASPAQSPGAARADQPAAGSSPAKVALLVGIDEYAPGTPGDFPKLRGCKRDVALASELLEQRFGFDPSDVTVLVDGAASLEGIVRAFHDRLIARAGPTTEAVFWFSGHGSRIPDASGKEGLEQDGLDSTLLAWDSRSGGRDGSYDFSDDLLASLRAALTARTARVTIITDSCHSGGATRSGTGPRFRGARLGSQPLDLRSIEGFWPSDVPILEDGDARRDASKDYVHIAACSPTQLAQEIDLDGGAAQGALTFFLIDGLRNAQPTTSYEELARNVAVRLTTRFPGQTPWHEGQVARTVFGSRFAERPPGFFARPLGGGQVRVEAGSMVGLRPGSELAIFGASDTEPLGTAVVSKITALGSLAEWKEPAPTDVPEIALRAVELTRPNGQPPLAVHVADPALAELLAESDWITVVAPQDAEYEVTRDGTDGGRVLLAAAEGLRIWKEDPESAAREWTAERRGDVARVLEGAFSDEICYRSLQALASNPGLLSMEARFVDPLPTEMAAYGPKGYVDAGVHREQQRRAVSASSEFSVGAPGPKEKKLAILEVQNPTDVPVFVAVLSITEDRNRHVIYPQTEERDITVAPGKSIRAPIQVEAGENWLLERPMRDRYLVFATREFADFKRFAKDGGLTRGGPGDAMPALIAEALSGPALRGARKIQADEPESWGVVAVDLLVR